MTSMANSRSQKVTDQGQSYGSVTDWERQSVTSKTLTQNNKDLGLPMVTDFWGIYAYARTHKGECEVTVTIGNRYPFGSRRCALGFLSEGGTQ